MALTKFLLAVSFGAGFEGGTAGGAWGLGGGGTGGFGGVDVAGIIVGLGDGDGGTTDLFSASAELCWDGEFPLLSSAIDYSRSGFRKPFFSLRFVDLNRKLSRKSLKRVPGEPAKSELSTQNSTLVGVTVAILIVGAVAAIGYYQVVVAPNFTSTSSTGPPPVVCPSSQCANVTIPMNAGTPPSGYTQGAKTTFGFSPDSITVVIGINNTVYWSNKDGTVHTATSDSGDPAGFDTGTIAAGSSAQFTFTIPGTYTYHCTFHSWMQGTIKVMASPTGTTTGATTSSTTHSSTKST